MSRSAEKALRLFFSSIMTPARLQKQDIMLEPQSTIEPYQVRGTRYAVREL